MANQGLTIAQAARTTGLSTRTIRRYIQGGRISAQLVPGKHGKEFRIANIPEELTKHRTIDKQPGQTIDIIRELQDKNLQLATQLGAATERIRSLENQVNGPEIKRAETLEKAGGQAESHRKRLPTIRA